MPSSAGVVHTAEIDDVFPQWEGGFPLILGGGHIIEQRSGTLRGPSYRHLERKLPFASGGREGGIVLQLACLSRQMLLA